MSMSRRMFGKLAALSPAAAPAAIEEIAKQQAWKNAAYNGVGQAGLTSTPDAPPKHMFSDWWGSKELAELVNNPAKVRAELAHYIVPSTLDPDLFDNRSMSLSTKMRLQRDRNITREIEQRKHKLIRDLMQAKNWMTHIPAWVSDLMKQ